jgi:hypothetical protein
MLTIETFDDLNNDWGSWELPLPADCRDAHEINKALCLAVGDEPDAWEVETSFFAGPIFLIVCTNDRDHVSIITIE